MGGVDHNDQLRGYYHVRLKCRKFYKYIVWFLFDVAIVNSFILCKHFTHLGITDLKTFRTELAKSLIGSYCSRKHPGRPTQATPPPKQFCNSLSCTRFGEAASVSLLQSLQEQKTQLCGTASYYVTLVKTMTASFSTTEGIYCQPPHNLASTHFYYYLCSHFPPSTYTFAATIFVALSISLYLCCCVYPLFRCHVHMNKPETVCMCA